MRAAALMLTSLVALCGCAAARHASAANADLSALRPCETRTVTLDGADVVVAANADGSVATIAVPTSAPSAAEALRQARAVFGLPRVDTQRVAHQSKWGLVIWTDRCGRPVHVVPAR
ncbi:MAG TPA: hypothetical protein VJP76_06355 [Candidatus Tumulicola sp.]|nr:hypothetical protein [Candidatus Tumulicola sp.]